uniref:Cadherin domain-containing protein n=1 Tax=Timema tahoe TaxID=61484 RepID=A0A7R9IT14_9NEOP|nr:unnamed protein product [Timema tahoe]
MPTGMERRKIVDTVDRDEVDELDDPPTPVCYFIVGGNDGDFFTIEPLRHEVMVAKELDREASKQHLILIKATEDCIHSPANQNFFDPTDDTYLKVIVEVEDINDNAPHFVKKVFTGGVTTEADFGKEFMQVKVRVGVVGASVGLGLEAHEFEVNFHLCGECPDSDETRGLPSRPSLRDVPRLVILAEYLLMAAPRQRPKSQLHEVPSGQLRLKAVFRVIPEARRLTFSEGLTHIHERPSLTEGGANSSHRWKLAKAIDIDEGENAEVSYYQVGQIQMTLTEGLENVQTPPFLVDQFTGVVQLNFDPQKGMKGYFDFLVEWREYS